MTVIARSPFELYYEGSAESLTATNRVGVFDILPGHADFFSMLVPCDVRIDTGAKADPIVISVTSGIVTVRNNEAHVFLNM